MVIGDFDISISDYWGKIGNSVAIIVSIIYDNNVYEGLYCYTNESEVYFEVDDILEEKLDCVIGDTIEYNDILTYLMDNRVGYDEIYNQLDYIPI